jgi:hypothetical protein
MKPLITILPSVAILALCLEVGCSPQGNPIKKAIRQASTCSAQPIASTVRGNKTLAQVEKSITTAGSRLNWIVKPAGTDTMEASYFLNPYVLTIGIAYTATDYTMTYKASQNMDFDPVTDTINKNYLKWLSDFDFAIQNELAKF